MILPALKQQLPPADGPAHHDQLAPRSNQTCSCRATNPRPSFPRLRCYLSLDTITAVVHRSVQANADFSDAEELARSELAEILAAF